LRLLDERLMMGMKLMRKDKWVGSDNVKREKWIGKE